MRLWYSTQHYFAEMYQISSFDFGVLAKVSNGSFLVWALFHQPLPLLPKCCNLLWVIGSSGSSAVLCKDLIWALLKRGTDRSRVYLGVRSWQDFLCLLALFCCTVLFKMFLLPLVYIIREFHRFLHRGKAQKSPLPTMICESEKKTRSGLLGGKTCNHLLAG